MTTIAELTDHLKKLIAEHPSKHPYDLNDILQMVETLETPVIAAYMEGGLLQEVQRLNDAPFELFVHDHDIDGTTTGLCQLTWNSGEAERAVISSYDLTNVFIKDEGPYWQSLRNPVEIESSDIDNAEEAEDDEPE